MELIVERVQTIVQHLIDAHLFPEDTTLHQISAHLKSCIKEEITDKLDKQVSKLEIIRQKSIDEIRSVSLLNRQLEVLVEILNKQKPISLSFLVNGLIAVFISLINPVQAEWANKIVTLVKEKLSDVRKTPPLIVKHRLISELLKTFYEDVLHLENKQNVQNASNYEPYDRLYQHLSDSQFGKDLSKIASNYGFSQDEALRYLSYRDDPDCIDAYENELHRYAQNTIESERSLQNFIETTPCIDKNCFSDDNEIKHYNKLFLAYCERAVKDSDRVNKNSNVTNSTIPDGLTEQPVVREYNTASEDIAAGSNPSAMIRDTSGNKIHLQSLVDIQPVNSSDILGHNNIMVLWLDDHIGQPDNCRALKMDFRKITNSLKMVESVDSCRHDLPNVKNRKLFCIIQGKYAKEIVPDIVQMASLSMPPVIYLFTLHMSSLTEWAAEQECIMNGGIFDHEQDLLETLRKDLTNYVKEQQAEYQHLFEIELMSACIKKLTQMMGQCWKTNDPLALADETSRDKNQSAAIIVH